MKVLEELFEQLEHNEDEMISIRRYLHKHPELSFKETNTASFIAKQLNSLNIEVREQVGGNGVLGIIRGEQPGKTIAFRADFDALPIQEETEHDYKSTNHGVMHACGHDGHTASLLAFAKVLQQNRNYLKGNVVLIHQHAEEQPPGGALPMIEDGALENVEKVFAAHLATGLDRGTVSLRSGAMKASVDHFTIKIQGRGGHGAYPHQTRDAIVVASQFVTQIQQIISRRINPIEPAVVTVGKFQAGEAFNIIADHAEIEGTVRALNKEVRVQIEEEIRRHLESLKVSHDIQYELNYLHGYPVLHNDQTEVDSVKKVIEQTNLYNIVERDPELGAEDFAYFLQHVPGAYFNVGARDANDPTTHYPHHHPKFNFDEHALLDTGKIFLSIAHHYLIKGAD